MENILTTQTASISELKANPMKLITESHGEATAILNRNKVAFYTLPAELFEMMLDKLDDIELAKIVMQREGQETIKVNIDDYISG